MVITDQDFAMVAGDDQYIEIHVVDEDGVVVNITNNDIDWWLKESNDSTAALVHKTTTGGGGINISDGPGGIFQVHLEPADTDTLAPDKYFHGARIVDTALETSTVTVGHIDLLPSAEGA